MKKFLSQNKYLFLISFIVYLLAPMITKPKFEWIDMHIFSEDIGATWELLEFKAQNLGSNLEMYPPNSSRAKYVFRFTIPVIMKVFGLNRVSFYFLMLFVGFLTIFCWTRISHYLSQNYTITFLSSLSLVSSFYGVAFYVYTPTAMQALSYFLIAFTIALYLSDKKYLMLIPLPFLFFNDERGALAFSIIGLFILFDLIIKKGIDIKSIFKNFHIIGLLFVFILCFLFRLSLIQFFGMKMPLGMVGFEVFKLQWRETHLGFFSGVEGFVFPIFLSLVYLYNRKQYFLLTFNTAVILLFMIGGLMLVTDMTMSIAYMTPLALLILFLEKDFKVLKILFTGVVLINLFFPTIVCIRTSVSIWYSACYDIIWKLLIVFNLS